MWKPLFAAAALAVATPAIAAPQPGKTAPDFTLTSAAGKQVSLSDFRGKTVVLEWTNKGCPFVQKHYKSGNMQALQSEAAKDGVVWLTVNSSAKGQQGYVTAADAKAEMKTFRTTPTAYLLDHDGKAGHLYGATATPHMYVIDPKGTLAYMGAIDSKPTANAADIEGAENYVRTALAAVEDGKMPKVPATRAYGCSVKYAH